MADAKLSSLTALTQSSLASSDEFYVAHSGGSYSILRSELDKQWVTIASANVANGYAALDSSGNITANVILRNDTASNLSSIVLATGQAGWTTDTKLLKIGDGSTAFSSLPAINPAAVLLTPGGGINQTIKPSATNTATSLTLEGNGTGGATLNLRGNAPSGTGSGVIRVNGYHGSQQQQHTIDGSAGVTFDITASNTGIGSDGAGDWFVGGNLQFGNLLACMNWGAGTGTGPQAIATTSDTSVTSSIVVCSGTTTAPKLPPVGNGGIVFIKNLGSGNCVVKQDSGDSGSIILPLNSATAASALTLSTTQQAIFVSDLSSWYRIA